MCNCDLKILESFAESLPRNIKYLVQPMLELHPKINRVPLSLARQHHTDTIHHMSETYEV